MKKKHTVAIVGLGRMGLGIAKNCLRSGVDVLGYDLSPEMRKKAKRVGVMTVDTLEALANSSGGKPELVWIMVPIGRPVDTVLQALSDVFPRGSILIDGGNADFRDSIRRREAMKRKGMYFVACGTSGGIRGAEMGPPMTLDAAPKAAKKIMWFFDALGGNAVVFSKPGRGHLAKTIHNAIEYGMIQSLAEGVALYRAHGYSQAEIKKLFKTWSQGSIIESKLVHCLLEAFEEIDFSGSTTLSVSETAHLVDK